ncbi:MAG: peptide ABC transporter substrate-binding protein [Clostridiales bacterium]|jgi:oligopeptide transport system substrate-binding protein|nr:peptide ABC transporter substrate-binding protein [Eubacteriales bacterium]MDH7566127.1 peptide ABC transporter substrate-binding protein [Clostridiales bacterium]
MVKKIMAFLLAAVMLASVLAGCGQGGNKPAEPGTGAPSSTAAGAGGTVNAIMGEEPQTLDPAMNQSVDGGTYILHVFEGLTKVDKDGKTVPGIAEKWDVSADGLKYTFHLRNAKWSDGKPVTAGDFEYAWKRALDPKTASLYAFQLYYLKNGEAYNSDKAKAEDVGVKAVDDKTLEVTLQNPTPYFLDLMHFPTYMPVRKDIIEQYKDQWTQKPETYIGNGAFKMKDWKHKEELVLEKNENYWDKDKIQLKEIHWKLTSDDSAALNAFESGEIDFVNQFIPQAEQPNLIKEGKEKIYPMVGTYYLYFNTARKPLNDVRVRKALALAIDRQYICEKVTQRGEKPAVGVVPYNVPGSEAGKDFRSETGTYLPTTPNVEEAKKLLAEAGYPDGKGFPELEIYYNTMSSHKAIMEAIQEQWKTNLGITVKPPNMEWKVLQGMLDQKNFTIARMGWIGDYNDPMTFLDMWTTTSGQNKTNWSNKNYDQLIETAKKTADPKARWKALDDAEKIFMDEVPACPIYYYVNQNLESPKLKGQITDMLGFIYMHYATIEK